ncbi:hypothetical protein ACWKTL_29685 [Bacillus toyonensis]
MDLRGTPIANEIANQLKDKLTKGNKREVTINQFEFNPPHLDFEATLRSRHDPTRGITAYSFTSDAKIHTDVISPDSDDFKVCVNNKAISGCLSLGDIVDLTNLPQ